MIIAVIGGEQATPGALEQAEAAGRELAQRGCALICGGRGGIMEAACRGASEAGGTTIGVLPGADRDQINPYVQIPIVTGLGEARNVIVALTADALIAIDGEYGTLSEIAHALRNGKPVIGLDTWQPRRADGHDAPILRAETAKEAVELAVRAAHEGTPTSSSAKSRAEPGSEVRRAVESLRPYPYDRL